MAVEVRTERYEWAYGKKPRGDGMWAFGDSKHEKIEFFNGTYSEAKAKAIKWAKMNNMRTIYVET